MSGPPLGRKSQTVSREEKKQAAADEAIRNQIEGKFGQGKRRFGLGRVMAKLASTSAAQISLTFLVMNLERALQLLFFVLCWLRLSWLINTLGQCQSNHRITHYRLRLARKLGVE
jgi:IS5 family transposase